MLPEIVLHGDEKKRFAGWGFPVVLGFVFACGTNASTDAIVPFDRPYFLCAVAALCSSLPRGFSDWFQNRSDGSI